MREMREVKMLCTGRGSHRRTVLGKLEEAPIFASEDEGASTYSTGDYEWIAWNTDRMEDLQGRARFNCPRCPLDVKWKRETVQAVGAKLAGVPGVSEVDLSAMPATLI